MNQTSVLSESTTTERAAEITYMVMQGDEFTTLDIARRYSMTWAGADRMLNKISRRVPIYKDDDSKWRKL